MDHQAVAEFVATTRTDTIIATGTYGGALITAIQAVLNWFAANQPGLAVFVMLITAGATVLSALYGIYHKHCIRKIAASQGFDALRKSDRNFSEE